MKLKSIIASLLCFLLLSESIFAAEFRFSPRPNKASLIEWREWSRESLAEAKRKDRLILLSLSAVWCHWCHVMDETTYSDNDIISFINSNFIPIRVDTDKRPDIDALYNQGGWPSTVILSSSGDIIDGGTYLPPEEMKDMMSKWVDLFSRDPEEIKKKKDSPRKRSRSAAEDERGHPRASDITNINGMLKLYYDKRYGGFGVSQKFPNPDAIDFLLSGYVMTNDMVVGTMITTTLNNMMESELYDHVEGGFFRYATKPDWSSPHFEKILSDNAGIIRNFAEMYAISRKEQYRKVVADSLHYVETRLMEKDSGRFYGSQDAEEEYYRKSDRKNLNVPYIDTTTYADSQSLMITALVSAYAATGKSEYLNLAEKGIAFILDNMYEKGAGVYHYYSGGTKHIKGFLLDTVLFGSALLDLYNVTGNKRYLSLAEQIADLVVMTFYDHETDHFVMTRSVTVQEPETTGILHDYQLARSNYRAAIFLGRIFAVYGEAQVRTIIDEVLSTFREEYDRYPPSAPLYGIALRWFIEDPVSIVIVAHRDRANMFLAEITKFFIPEKSLLILSPDEDGEMIRERGYPVAVEALYLCKGKRCSRPLKDPDGVQKVMEEFLRSGGA